MGTDQTIDTHIACVRCGYDLHGLDHEGKCPECGLDAFFSRTHNRPPLTRAEIGVAKQAAWGAMVSTMSPWVALVALVAMPLSRSKAASTVLFWALVAWAVSTAWTALWLVQTKPRERVWSQTGRDLYVMQSLVCAAAIGALAVSTFASVQTASWVCSGSFLVLLLCATRHGTELRGFAELCETASTTTHLAPAYQDVATPTSASRAVLYAFGLAFALGPLVGLGSELFIVGLLALIAAGVGVVASFATFSDSLILLMHLRRCRGIDPE